MNRDVEGLENRTLNSATSAVLFADQMKLAADSNATVLALRQLGAAEADLTKFVTDLTA